MSPNAMTYRLGAMFALALFPACSGPAGPTDEQVSRDIISFLQEKCEPLGAKSALRPVVVTNVRIENRKVGDERAEMVAVAQGRLEPNSAYRGYVFSDYCPVGTDRRSEVSVVYTRRDGKWYFNGDVRHAGESRGPLNTASTQGVTR